MPQCFTRSFPRRFGQGCRVAISRVALAVVVLVPFLSTGAMAQCVDWANRTGMLGGRHPSSREVPKLTFDSARARTVAVAGFDVGNENIAPTYEYDGSTWVRKSPPVELDGPRFGFSLTYDAVRNVSVFFGGYKGIGGSARNTNTLALWNGNNWQVVPPTGLWPPANGAAHSVFDPVRGRVIVILADVNAPNMWQTWEWSGTGWAKGPSVGPIDSGATQMVFDTWRNRAFVYTVNPISSIEESWEYASGATAAQGVWTRIAITGDPFVGRYGSELAFDPFRGRILRFGGRGIGSIYGYVNVTWWWNSVERRWELQLGYPNRPGDRGGAGLAYDKARDRMVMFGGIRVYVDSQGTGRTEYYGDTWEFFDPSPGFINWPSSVTVDGGATAIFAAATIGENLSLQWIHNGNPIPNATGVVLGVPNSSAASQGWYWLRASNSCGTRDSPGGYLTVRPPSNDRYVSPATIITGTTAGVTLGSGNDGTATCGNSDTSPDVWHIYTAPATGNLTIDTCGSDFDTVLSFHACCPGLGAVIACSDDAPPAGCAANSSAISMSVAQGQRFLVRVAGYRGAVGRYRLNTALVPFNNSCSNATEVTAGTYAGSTIGASGDGIASCGTSNGSPDIWYRFRSDCSGTLNLSTFGSSYDTVLSVHNGCVTSTIVCNDDAQLGVLYSEVAVSVAPGSDYRIRVSGYNGAAGSVVLTVNPPVPSGDDCETAGAIGLGETTIGTRCARSSNLPVAPWCSGAAGDVPFNDRWFRYTAVQAGTLEIRACNTTFTPVVAVYGHCPTSAYDAISCGGGEDSCGDPPPASVPSLPGDQYLIRIGGIYGLNALTGSATLALTLVPFEQGACCLASGCSLVAAYACNGTFLGEGTVCSPQVCPSFAGACCVGTACQVFNAEACANAAGVFNGTGTTCTPSPTNLINCCLADFDRSGQSEVLDIILYLNAWFASDPQSDIDGVPGIDVLDIITFLNLFFAGCG